MFTRREWQPSLLTYHYRTIASQISAGEREDYRVPSTQSLKALRVKDVHPNVLHGFCGVPHESRVFSWHHCCLGTVAPLVSVIWTLHQISDVTNPFPLSLGGACRDILLSELISDDRWAILEGNRKRNSGIGEASVRSQYLAQHTPGNPPSPLITSHHLISYHIISSPLCFDSDAFRD